MNTALQIKDHTITAAEIIPLLDNYRMLPQFLREVIIDRAIVNIEYTAAEFANVYQDFLQQYQLESASKLETWMNKRSITKAQLEARMIRNIKLDKFKQEQWGHQLESYFLERKLAFEQAVFSLIRVKSVGMARELYHRLQEGENSFAELAKLYSLGEEANNNGLVGLVKLIDLHHILAQMLHRSQPGQLLPPRQIEDHWVIVRLEKYLPARLDKAMGERLLNELCDRWLEKQLATINSSKINAV
ncbi:MAG: peptidylprolyl isomerase [Pleurocapsa sp. SU_5_0]|nr:peptidylprolyl isomerase [Pleurocapsa sp. SU_5_0]NJR46210.1 peptidylprolyl isomerase [Hyellaceae cyanobacterium CSU_1_1]